jgi:hypothetical protein
MDQDSDLKKVLSIFKEAEGQARIDVEGRAYFNGVRFVDHPANCDCGRSVMLMRDHCWCCGYSELGSKCGCMPERDRGICTKCGSCPVHCPCNNTIPIIETSP